MKTKDLFLLNWRKVWIIVISWFVFVLLHNLISGLFGIEEALFFILAIFVLPIYVLVTVIYSLIYILKKKSKKKV